MGRGQGLGSQHASQVTWPGGLHPGRICLQGGSVSRGVFIQRGLHPGGWAYPPSDTTGYCQWAGGTHPTGMHSCLESERAFRIQFQRYIGAVIFQFLRYSDTAYRIVSFTLNEELAKFKDISCYFLFNNCFRFSQFLCGISKVLKHNSKTV